jgi:hypothetical protein
LPDQDISLPQLTIIVCVKTHDITVIQVCQGLGEFEISLSVTKQTKTYDKFTCGLPAENEFYNNKKAVCTEPVTQVLVMDALVFCMLGRMNAYVQKTTRQVVFTTGIAGCHTIDCVFSHEL